MTYGYQWQRCGYAAAILADHPVGYWPLDEDAGPKGDDASGNNNGGTYQGTPVFGVPGALAEVRPQRGGGDGNCWYFGNVSGGGVLDDLLDFGGIDVLDDV